MATQDEINSFVEEIMPYFEVEPVEDDAVQQSWPRLDRGLSDVQDMVRFQNMNGIYGRGGQPYWLRNNGSDSNTNGTNTMLLTVSQVTGTAEGTIKGAFHRLRDDLELEFPPVSSNTLQHVVLEYDPIRSADGGDPIVAKVVTSLERSQGKEFLQLWTVDRRPNQLLTDAPVERYRPFVAPTVTYNDEGEFPDAESLLSGTVAIDRRNHTMFMSMQPYEADEDGNTSSSAWWINLNDPPWVDRLDSSYTHWSAEGPHPSIQQRGRNVKMRGTLAIANGNSFNTSQNGGSGYWIMTLPSGQRPRKNHFFITAISGSGTIGYARIFIGYTGFVRAYVSRTCRWISLDGIEFDTE